MTLLEELRLIQEENQVITESIIGMSVAIILGGAFGIIYGRFINSMMLKQFAKQVASKYDNIDQNIALDYLTIISKKPLSTWSAEDNNKVTAFTNEIKRKKLQAKYKSDLNDALKILNNQMQGNVGKFITRNVSNYNTVEEQKEIINHLLKSV